MLESGEVALDGAGVYDGVFEAPGLVAPWALGELEPVSCPSGPLVAPDGAEAVPVAGVAAGAVTVVVPDGSAAVVSVVAAAVSSGASMPPLDWSTTGESVAG